MTCAEGKYILAVTRVARSRGGFVIWVELPEEVYALDLCRQALERRIRIASGPVFSASGKYRNCIHPQLRQALGRCLRPGGDDSGAHGRYIRLNWVGED